MTEQQWLTSVEVPPMLAFLNAKASDRKMRLFAAACVAQILPLAKLLRNQTAEALAEVERYADGGVTKAAMKKVRERLAAARGTTPSHRTTADDFVCYAIEYASQPISYMKAVPYSSGLLRSWGHELPASPQSTLLRCIVGNPFRPVTADPAWLTSDVRLLATGIYEEKAFDRLPILADALQDAGCENEEILSHLRSELPHARGCWVVDLLTGRE